MKWTTLEDIYNVLDKEENEMNNNDEIDLFECYYNYTQMKRQMIYFSMQKKNKTGNDRSDKEE